MRTPARSYTICSLVALLVLATAVDAGAQQQRDWRVHTRGMLHQTIFNTGELGRPYSAGGTIVEGRPSMEWPAFSRLILDRQNFPGQHNSFGSGVWLGATREDGRRLYSLGGAVSNSNGDPVPVIGVHSSPVRITRMENYPVLASGDLNPAYDPDEAEEIIISEWDTPTGIRVTRTSRAWSYPGYDGFIIYEYEFTNRLNERLRDVYVTFANTFGPSMFGYQRNVGEWTEGGLRGQAPAGLGDHFARFDLKRWMTYNHDREGQPETDQSLFNAWRQEGNRGGLNSPQAAGMTVLYYDHELLARRGETDQIWLLPADTLHMWDDSGRPKQPFMLRYENGNLYDEKVAVWMDPNVRRRTSIFQSIEDSTRFANQFEPDLWDYWKGRTSSSANLSWWQPVARGYGFYPFILEAGQTLRFAVAEVVGYGPGRQGDEVYRDLGGTVRAGVDAGNWFNPVATWYNRQTYPHLGPQNHIGSDYLQDNPLPWYVHPDVVSVRDVADRAIESYTGRELVKYDTLQYDPPSAPSSGRYNTIPIPFPAPVISIENTSAAANRIIWGSQVESFSTPRLRAPFSHYEVLRAPHPLGPWTVLAEVQPNDARYLEDGNYAVLDTESNLGDNVAYAVVSIDQQGGRSGKTNLLVHETQAPPANALDRVYVVPNPLIVSSGLTGTDSGGDISDRIQFMGLTDRATIRIYSYTGQLVETIEHDRGSYGNPWYQLSINNQLIASGVYFFVVEDHDTGARANGKFVVIH